MSIDDRQQQTTVNVQEKANLIWAIADKLVGVYKPHEYGNVILPMCVIKRFEDTLAPTREKVLETNRELDEKKIEMKRGFLEACVLAAVNLGDDTDTTAAVAGALAGIVYGAEAIPARWLSALRGRDVIEACLF